MFSKGKYCLPPPLVGTMAILLLLLICILGSLNLAVASIDLKVATPGSLTQWQEYEMAEKLFTTSSLNSEQLSEESVWSRKNNRILVEESQYKTPAFSRLTSGDYVERKRSINSGKKANEDYFEYDATLQWTHVSLKDHPLVMDVASTNNKLYILVDGMDKAKMVMEDLKVGFVVSLDAVDVKIISDTNDVSIYRQIQKRKIIKGSNGLIYIELETEKLEFMQLFSQFDLMLSILPKGNSSSSSSSLKRGSFSTSLDINNNNGKAIKTPLILQFSSGGQINFHDAYFHADTGVEMSASAGINWVSIDMGFFSICCYPRPYADVTLRLYGSLNFNFMAESNSRTLLRLPLTDIFPSALTTTSLNIGSISFNVGAELAIRLVISSGNDVFNYGFATGCSESFDIGVGCSLGGCSAWARGNNIRTPYYDHRYINMRSPQTVFVSVVPNLRFFVPGLAIGGDFTPHIVWRSYSTGSGCGAMRVTPSFGIGLTGYNSGIGWALLGINIGGEFIGSRSYDITLFTPIPLYTFDVCSFWLRDMDSIENVNAITATHNINCCNLDEITYNDQADIVKVIVTLQNSDIDGADGIYIESDADSIYVEYGQLNYTSNVGNASVSFAALGSGRTITFSLHKDFSDSVSFEMESYRKDLQLSERTFVSTGWMNIQADEEGPIELVTKVEVGSITVSDGTLSSGIWDISDADYPLSLRYSGSPGYITLYPVYELLCGDDSSLFISASSTQTFVLAVSEKPQSLITWDSLVFSTKMTADVTYSITTSSSLSLSTIETIPSSETFTTSTSKVFTTRPKYIYVKVTNSLSIPIVFYFEATDMYLMKVTEDSQFTYTSPKDTAILIKLNKTKEWSKTGISITLDEDKSNTELENVFNVDTNIITVFNRHLSIFSGQVVGESVFGFSPNYLADLINVNTLYLRIENIADSDAKGILKFNALKSDGISCSVYFMNSDKDILEDIYVDQLQVANSTFFCMEIDSSQYTFNMQKLTKASISQFLKKLTTSDKKSVWDSIMLPVIINELENGDLYKSVQLPSSKELCIPMPSFDKVVLEETDIEFTQIDPTLFIPVPSTIKSSGSFSILNRPYYLLLGGAGIIGAIVGSTVGGVILITLLITSIVCIVVLVKCCSKKAKVIQA